MLPFKDWSRDKRITTLAKAPVDVAMQLEGVDLEKTAITVYYPDSTFITVDTGNGAYNVLLGNKEASFNTLHEAEKYLWESWAYSNSN